VLSFKWRGNVYTVFFGDAACPRPIETAPIFFSHEQSSNASSHQLMTALVLASDVDLKKKQKQALNFNMAELSLQKSVCGSASRECKRGCSTFIHYKILSH